MRVCVCNIGKDVRQVLFKNYISTGETAEKWGVRPRNVQRYLAEERVSGVKKYDNYWMIPTDAKKPKDPCPTRKHEAFSKK